jgi:fumarylacetoacetate (FAA) hydrolase
MKFVSFLTVSGEERVGLFIDGATVDLAQATSAMGLKAPSTMAGLLSQWTHSLTIARQVESEFRRNKIKATVAGPRLLAPVPHPTSCRDGYAFRQHVATARRNRGVEMIAEFDQFPVFYFTNHNSICGEGDIVMESDHLQKLDFELECAIVIGQPGKNIQSKEADAHIAGLMIMNDLSARVLQMEEMALSLGPAKGKDFATAVGPWLVTPGELESYRIPTPFGNTYDLRMTASHNGKQVSEGNLKDMNWTFAELIERASYGVQLYPGDIIGSGTIGTGCYLELNGTWTIEAKARGEVHTPIWLQPGDTIELEIAGLGRLTNKIIKADRDYSILAKKKQIKG